MFRNRVWRRTSAVDTTGGRIEAFDAIRRWSMHPCHQLPSARGASAAKAGDGASVVAKDANELERYRVLKA